MSICRLYLYPVTSLFPLSDFRAGFFSGSWGGSNSRVWQPADSEGRGLWRHCQPPRVAPPVAVAAVHQWGWPAGITGLPGAQHPAEHQPSAEAAPQWGGGNRGRPPSRRGGWGHHHSGGEWGREGGKGLVSLCLYAGGVWLSDHEMINLHHMWIYKLTFCLYFSGFNDAEHHTQFSNSSLVTVVSSCFLKVLITCLLQDVHVIVQNALRLFSQDRTGLADFALESGGQKKVCVCLRSTCFIISQWNHVTWLIKC